jgi:hypothetical protein
LVASWARGRLYLLAAQLQSLAICSLPGSPPFLEGIHIVQP